MDNAKRSTPSDDVCFCRLHWDGGPVDIEHRWIAASSAERPLMVFLHEGLGSLGLWRDYPDTLCRALDWHGLVYSRPGYGRSSPRPPHRPLQPDFMHRQANELLPALFDALEVRHRFSNIWLFGHSDGGSIALIHAAQHPGSVQGLVVVAPHVMVETISIDGIQQAREAYLQGGLKARLAPHHHDPDATFWGWNGIWLSPDFRDWSIEALLPQIRCPVLALQGSADAYGTLLQIERIAALAPQTQLSVIPDCGHSPHREQPETLTRATVEFVAGLRHSASSHPGAAHP